MSAYLDALVKNFWQYQKEQFPDWQEYFDGPRTIISRPPVFLKEKADHNVLFKQGISSKDRKNILDEIPIGSRHKWFGSMKSSQALAQSVFANLKQYNRLHILQDVLSDDGEPLFENVSLENDNLLMEYVINFLGEPTPTNVDCFIPGEYNIAIECKFTESEFGSCSRPRLTQRNSNYESDYCDGSYTIQRGRKKRCSLSDRGVLYWDYIPELFSWNDDSDHSHCPIRFNYQLVRNVLAACISSDGKVRPENGHAIVIYDDRNPEFQKHGKAYKEFHKTRAALFRSNLLRKCSWQRIIKHIRRKGDMDWFLEQIQFKYGIEKSIKEDSAMARLLVFIPQIDSATTLYFTSRGESWKLRDYSGNIEEEVIGNQNSSYTVNDILSMVKHKEKAQLVPLNDVAFWKNEIKRVNGELRKSGILKISVDPPETVISTNNDESSSQTDPNEDIIAFKSNKLIKKMDQIAGIDPSAAAGIGRKIAEIIINDLSKIFGIYDEALYQQVNYLKEKQVIPEKIFILLTTIRKLGNIGLHDNENEDNKLTPKDIHMIIIMLESVLDWYLKSGLK